MELGTKEVKQYVILTEETGHCHVMKSRHKKLLYLFLAVTIVILDLGPAGKHCLGKVFSRAAANSFAL